jgi:hypothetical protein
VPWVPFTDESKDTLGDGDSTRPAGHHAAADSPKPRADIMGSPLSAPVGPAVPLSDEHGVLFTEDYEAADKEQEEQGWAGDAWDSVVDSFKIDSPKSKDRQRLWHRKCRRRSWKQHGGRRCQSGRCRRLR